MLLKAEQGNCALRGSLRPPGDKSISHRALILAGLAHGQSRITGFLDSGDTRATRLAMQQLGARYHPDGNGLRVEGIGKRGPQAPAAVLEMGNSGTAMRLLAGVLAGRAFSSSLSGDESLNSRPMRRILHPLTLMGARISATPKGTAPLRIDSGPPLNGITYESPVASAQVKSCVLLAGLDAFGITRVIEPVQSRDHTERMLPLFGVEVGKDTSVKGGSVLLGTEISVPADPSSAAFLVASALLVPGSEIELLEVGLNETRSGFFKAVQCMGADIDVERSRILGREQVGTIRVRYSGILSGIDVPQDWLPSMIDEIPVLLTLAACSAGTTRVRGASELRIKESDRLAVMASGLESLGITLNEYPDGIDVEGGTPQSGQVDGHGDHRCAMSFAVLGQVVRGGLGISGAGNIDTSYPGFLNDMQHLGAAVSATDVQ